MFGHMGIYTSLLVQITWTILKSLFKLRVVSWSASSSSSMSSHMFHGSARFNGRHSRLPWWNRRSAAWPTASAGVSEREGERAGNRRRASESESALGLPRDIWVLVARLSARRLPGCLTAWLPPPFPLSWCALPSRIACFSQLSNILTWVAVASHAARIRIRIRILEFKMGNIEKNNCAPQSALLTLKWLAV